MINLGSGLAIVGRMKKPGGQNWARRAFAPLLRIWHALTDPRLGHITDRERRLVERLRKEVDVLQPASPGIPSEADEFWSTNQERVRRLVQEDDPRRFLRWDVIVKTMFIGDAPYVLKELSHLKAHTNWKECWHSAIKESVVGHPKRFILYPCSSGNLIHHAYHLARFEQATGLEMRNMNYIVEIGGGYGSMCRLIHKLGFTGSYVILDLPEFSAIQRFYLNSHGINTQEPGSSEDQPVSVWTVSTLSALLQILTKVTNKRGTLIATWSLSEISIAMRSAILQAVEAADAFLIAYQECYDEIDNVEFFGSWRKTLQDGIRWKEHHIDHLPGNRYLFGVRTN
jgi:hypothetical protein